MHTVSQHFSKLLCCLTAQYQDEPDRPAILHKLSAGYVLPTTTRMPPSTTLDESSPTDELRRIFLSTGPKRDYDTATDSPNNQTSPPDPPKLSYEISVIGQKKPGRLESLAQHIRHKFSESTIGKQQSHSGDQPAELLDLSTSGQAIPNASAGVESGEHAELLSASQRSTGLTELLASRTGSENGYDSDARSIRTPTLSHVCTFKTGRSSTRQPLRMIQSEDADHPRGEDVAVSKNTKLQAQNPDQTDPGQCVELPSSVPIGCKTPIESALQTDLNGSTGATPCTPGKDQTHDIALIDPRPSHAPVQESVYIAEPARYSAMHSSRMEHQSGMNKVSRHSPQCTPTCDPNEGQESSVLAPDTRQRKYNLNLDLIAGNVPNDNAVDQTWTNSHAPSPPVTVVRIPRGNQGIRDEDQFETDTTEKPSGQSSEPLAHTQMPPTSATSIELNPPSSLILRRPVAEVDYCRLFPPPRYPGFIACESNRRPSDPATRRIFENGFLSHEVARAGSCQLQSHQKAMSDATRSSIGSKDETESCYSSSTNTNPRNLSCPLPLVSSGGPIHHNSLAIGGRRRSRSTYRHTSSSQHYRERKSTPNSQSDTKANERLSSDGASQIFNERNEQMSELGLGLPRHGSSENSASDVARRLTSSVAVRTDVRETSDGWLSEGRRVGWGYRFVDGTGQNSPQRQTSRQDSETLANLDDSRISESSTWQSVLAESCKSDELPKDPEPEQNIAHDRQAPLSAQSLNEHLHSLASSHLRKASYSADDVTVIVRPDRAFEKNRRKSVAVLTAKGPSSAAKDLSWYSKNKLKKISIQELARRVTLGAVSGQKRKDSTMSLREHFGIWASFPMAGRVTRNGPAGLQDRVHTYDFGSVEQIPSSAGTSQARYRQGDDLGRLGHQTTSRPSPARPKSLTLQGQSHRRKVESVSLEQLLAERAKRRRTGFAGKLRKLYRTRSSDVKVFTSQHGHRSSIAAGVGAEYPELECLPSEGAYTRRRFSSCDGRLAMDDDVRNDGLLEGSVYDERVNMASQASRYSLRPRNSVDWSKVYAGCVGSLSALQSETSVDRQDGHQRVFSLTSALEEDVRGGDVRGDGVRGDEEGTPKCVAHQSSEECCNDVSVIQTKRSSEIRMPGSFESY